VRTVRKSGLPRQVATFLRHYEDASTHVNIAKSRQITVTWKALAEKNHKKRLEQWKSLILGYIHDAHGEDVSNVVEKEFSR